MNILIHIGIRDSRDLDSSQNTNDNSALDIKQKHADTLHRPMTHIFLQRWSSNPEIGWISKVLYMIIVLTTWFQIIPDWTWFAHPVVQSQKVLGPTVYRVGLLFTELPLSPFRSDLIEQNVDIFLIQNIYWLITFSQVLFFSRMLCVYM